MLSAKQKLILANGFAGLETPNVDGADLRANKLVCNKVKINSKRGQSAMNAKERLECKYSDNVQRSIESEAKRKVCDLKRSESRKKLKLKNKTS